MVTLITGDRLGDPGRRDRRYWIIEVNDEPVGLINLADIDETHRRCAWAYYLASPSVRGLGVARPAYGPA